MSAVASDAALVAKVFDAFDRSADGYLDRDELFEFFSKVVAPGALLKQLKVETIEAAAEALLKRADADGDGALNPEELRGALAERGVDVSPQKLSHLYSLYCRGDGKLELVEFANLCGTLTTEHCEEDSFS